MARRKPTRPLDERPDPRARSQPADKMVLVEEGVRLSASRLWRLQREFFARNDPAVWAASRVPSYITTNAFIARAMASVAAAFLEDVAAGRLGATRPRERVNVVELGAGSGRFAFGFLRALEPLLLGAARSGVSARYVVTDLAPAPVAALRANPRFAPFVKKGLLDFAVFDGEAPGEIRLLESGETIEPGSRAAPLVAIGNYFFDGVPADLFEVRRGELHESLLTLSLPAGTDPEDPASLGRFHTSFATGPPTSAPYGEADLDALVRSLAARLADGHFLFPVAGLRLVRQLRALGGGRLLLLAADRGHVHEQALLGLDPPHLQRHGSFSIDVNFHAFAEEARASGGFAMLPAHHPTHLATAGFLWGCAVAARSRTREAFDDHLDAAGPEALYLVKLAVENRRERVDTERALGWLRASAFDAEVFLACAPAFLSDVSRAPPTVRLDLLDAARRVREGYYPIGEERDVSHALAELFMALDALPEAEACYRESLRLHGPAPDVLHELAVCLSALHRLPEALARVEEALALDPSYEPARMTRIALEAELKRRTSTG